MLYDEVQATQKALGYESPSSTAEMLERVRNYVLALNVESAELIQTLPWKPWAKDLVFNESGETLEEWADCYIFLLDIALALRYTEDELKQAVKAKCVKVTKRTQNGYGNPHKGETA